MHAHESGLFGHTPLRAFEGALSRLQVELVVLVGAHTPLGALSSGGSELDCVRAVGLGLDLTRRGKQNELKKAGLPWTASKSFSGSALLSPMVTCDGSFDLDDISFALDVNGEEKQRGHVNQMIFNIAHQVNRTPCGGIVPRRTCSDRKRREIECSCPWPRSSVT